MAGQSLLAIDNSLFDYSSIDNFITFNPRFTELVALLSPPLAPMGMHYFLANNCLHD